MDLCLELKVFIFLVSYPYIVWILPSYGNNEDSRKLRIVPELQTDSEVGNLSFA